MTYTKQDNTVTKDLLILYEGSRAYITMIQKTLVIILWPSFAEIERTSNKTGNDKFLSM